MIFQTRSCQLAAFGIGALLLALRPCAAAEFRFHRDGVLGTSFDLTVAARSSNDAARVEKAALDEIERLRRILSTYDTNSDISRINTNTTAVRVAPEAVEVLGAYETWSARSKGAYSGQLGGLIAAWKAAEKAGVPPTVTNIQPIVAKLAQPGWTLDRAAGTLTRRADALLNVDSFGKGYILSRAATAARGQVTEISGAMLNIGGDIFAWGSRSATSTVPWRVAVADPRNPADNFRPLTRLSVADRAVSTSAGYARGYRFGKTRYSHLLDPRTGFPATNAASATVIATDSGTANALATTLCVLTPEEGLQLARDTPGTECLIVAPDGKQFRSAGFAAFETKRAVPTTTKPSLWPAGFELSVAVTLKNPGDARAKRPYLVLWIENADGQPVRTVTLWGNKSKYFKDLPAWWRFAQDDTESVAAVTRATRTFGTYSIQWDGRDDQGEPLPPGTYNVTLEVTREHGTHAKRSVKIECGATPARTVIPAGSEFEEAPVVYGPRGG